MMTPRPIAGLRLLGALCIVWGCLLHASLADQAAGRRPNILFAMADDWGWPHAGAYGDRTVQTPAFDRLAREGVLFDHAYVSSPSCTPCRNSILTGQQFYRLEQGANLWSTLDVRYPNFMFVLRDNGYEIGHWRKAWGPGDYSAGGYAESPCGPRSSFEAFMQQRDPEKPFCFWFGTHDPHRGYVEGSGRESGIDVDGVEVPGFYPDHETVRSDIADYYFEVQRWDRDVADALARLEEAGELENTLVVMTGDHGMPFPRCKGNLYDWGARVPLAMRWGEGIPAARRLTDFVSLTDLAPTFLSLAGIDVPEAMTGRNLLPVVRDPAAGRVDPDREFVVFGRERHVPAQLMPSTVGYPARGLRTDDWLLILNLEPERWPAGVPRGATHPIDVHADCDGGPTKSLLLAHQDHPAMAPYARLCFAKRPAVELYDCRSDPFQLRNLADDPARADVVRDLQGRLTGYLAATGDPRFTDQPVRFDEYLYRRPVTAERVRLQAPGQHRQTFKRNKTSEVEMKYLLSVPDDYLDGDGLWPLILFLHGSGERGDDLERVRIHGPPRLAHEGKSLPFFIASPQCPSAASWTDAGQIEGLRALLADLVSRYRIDEQRIYLTGLSMGGSGTWKLAATDPDRFAAIAPICGRSEPRQAADLASLPTWVFHGELDEAVAPSESTDMVEAVQRAGGDIQLTLYPDVGHDSWTQTYANPELYDWFLQHRRGGGPLQEGP